jgi:N-acetylglucosaminyldiphosphoundecaprenol N-acetyl-beta-D-mannosaminyltransferase
MMPNFSFRVTGVRVDGVSMRQTLEHIERFIAEGRPRRVVTVNLEYLRHARSSPGFREALEAADLAVADGMPLLWASRLFRHPLPERITGVDLAEQCARLAAEKGYRLFLLGAGPGVAQSAAQTFRRRYPGLPAVGCYTPPIGEFSP